MEQEENEEELTLELIAPLGGTKVTEMERQIGLLQIFAYVIARVERSEIVTK